MSSKRIFKKVYYIYLAFLILFSILAILYVYKTLKEYENSNAETFIYSKLNDLSNEEINNYFIKEDNYEDNKINNIKKYFKESKYELKKIEDLKYEVLNNNETILEIELKKGESVQKLGLLKYNKLQIEKINLISEKGLYNYKIIAPSNFKISINVVEINKNNIIKEDIINGLDDLYVYGDMPKVNNYEINYLTKDPIIVISNEQNENVPVDKSNKLIDVSEKFKIIETKEEATKIIGEDIDVLKFAEDWSLFLTKDLSGSYYGFNTIKEYFIDDSNMYKKAYDWSHGVDITFTSKHVLKNPVFTNESVKNYQIYNENIFSAEVTLEKNMIVARKDKKDTIHSRIYYLKYNGEWKVVQMKAIVEEGSNNG